MTNRDELRNETLERLYQKIPELRGGWKTIMLPHFYWVNLTDLEFTVLYTLPGLQIKVTNKTMDYIDKRRKRLNINKAQQREEKIPKPGIN